MKEGTKLAASFPESGNIIVEKYHFLLYFYSLFMNNYIGTPTDIEWSQAIIDDAAYNDSISALKNQIQVLVDSRV